MKAPETGLICPHTSALRHNIVHRHRTDDRRQPARLRPAQAQERDDVATVNMEILALGGRIAAAAQPLRRTARGQFRGATASRLGADVIAGASLAWSTVNLLSSMVKIRFWLPGRFVPC